MKVIFWKIKNITSVFICSYYYFFYCYKGVSCDSCLKSNFNGRRYKCLICYDYDLCADCYEEGVTSTRHLVDRSRTRRTLTTKRKCVV